MTPEELLAADTKALLDNPILKKAIKDYRGAIIEQLENISIGNPDAVIKVVLGLQVLRGVERQLYHNIETAEMRGIQPEEY